MSSYNKSSPEYYQLDKVTFLTPGYLPFVATRICALHVLTLVAVVCYDLRLTIFACASYVRTRI
jgi:hypothetical protein